MEKSLKVLNRDQIKYSAIILMTFNHIAHILMTTGTVLYEVFEDIGYFTSITMCYFFVEGYFYTRSRRNYAKRLFIFALISEIPYVLAMGYFQLNVMFTFLICLVILTVIDSKLNKFLKVLRTGIDAVVGAVRLRFYPADSRNTVQIRQRRQEKAGICVDNNVRYFLCAEFAKLLQCGRTARICTAPQLLCGYSVGGFGCCHYVFLQRKKVGKTRISE